MLNFIKSENKKLDQVEAIEKKQRQILEAVARNMNNWTVVDQTRVGDRYNKEPEQGNQKQLRAEAFNNYYKHPYARGIVTNLVNFVFGSKGATVKHSPQLKGNALAKVEEVWSQFTRENKLRRKQREIGIRTFRDGEAFIKYTFFSNKTPKVTFLEPDWIDSDKPEAKHGIETDPKDVSVIKSYRVKLPGIGQSEEKLDPRFVQHIKQNVDDNVKRGRTELESVMKWLTNKANFLEARTITNILRNQYVMVRKGAMPGAMKANADNELKSTKTSGAQNKRKVPKGGSVITIGKDSDVEFINPNMGSGDASLDDRMISLFISAGVVLPEWLVTGDASNNNMASLRQATLTAQKRIQAEQLFFSEELEEMYIRVMQNAIKRGELPKETPLEPEFEFPMFDVTEMDKMVTAWANLYNTTGAISNETMLKTFGIDLEDELKRIKEEAKNELIKKPNLFVDPVETEKEDEGEEDKSPDEDEEEGKPEE